MAKYSKRNVLRKNWNKFEGEGKGNSLVQTLLCEDSQ